MAEQFDLCIDNKVMMPAKRAFNSCMAEAVRVAIRTGRMEGSANLKISFKLEEGVNDETGECELVPVIKYMAGLNIPTNGGIRGEIGKDARLIRDENGGYKLISNQISLDEMMKGA